MSVLYIMIPVALALAALAVAGFVWSVRHGQYDDVETPPIRAVFDDDEDAT